MYQIFGFLAPLLGILIDWIYMLVQNYGWAIILFTVIIRVILFPLAMRQQKSTSRMNAFQPMIKELQKKWANDRNRQNQELQKFYQENNIKMSGGCLPMIVNLLVLFGVIAVIQAPLQYIVKMPTEQIDNAVAIVQVYNEELDISANQYTKESILIGQMKENPQWFTDGINRKNDEGKKEHVTVEQEWVTAVTDFNFNFINLDLSRPPSGFNVYLIWPILSVVTMLLSQFIIMKFGGTAQQAGKLTMIIPTLIMGVIFAVFAFRIPIGFSLYYTASNIVMTFQQIILRRIYNPEKIQEEVRQEVEARKAASKKRTKKSAPVLLDNADTKGADNKKALTPEEMSESEIVKARIAMARALDEQKYGLNEKDKKEEPGKETIYIEATEVESTPDEMGSEKSGENQNIQNSEDDEADRRPEYKPGRRKRARQKKTMEDVKPEEDRQNA